jgi:biopolymer transport protein ExbD
MSETQNPANESSAAVNDLPNPAEFAPEHGGYVKKQKKAPPHEQNTDVNINSLLDVLSVILVFLMKSYSANTVQVKPSPDLQVPMSWSTQQAQESTAVTVTLKDVMVDDVPVMSFEGGKIPEQDRSSGGYLIDPLFQKLQEAVDHQKKIAQFNKKAEFKGLVTIIADRNVPFSLLTQVMYTAGQAQFSKFKFAAVKTER